MPNGQAKFTIIQLYDPDYADDLRAAGLPDMAESLERIVKKLAEDAELSDSEEQEAIDLAGFMRKVAGQAG